MAALRKQITDLYYAVSADIEHGECFYDPEMFNEFINTLDKMKELAQKYYEENRQKVENEDAE